MKKLKPIRIDIRQTETERKFSRIVVSVEILHDEGVNNKSTTTGSVEVPSNKTKVKIPVTVNKILEILNELDVEDILEYKLSTLAK